MDIGYGRVSTEEQNLDLQIDAFGRDGLPSDDIYIDKISGSKAKRKGLDLALKRLRDGDRLVVWKVDRLSRDVHMGLQIAQTLNEIGVVFKSITEPMVDIVTPLGRYMFIHLLAHAQLEREQLIERTLNGMESAKQRGRFPGRKNYLTPDDLHQLKIQLAFTEDSLEEIAPRFRIKTRTIFNYVPRGRKGLLERLQSGAEKLDAPPQIFSE